MNRKKCLLMIARGFMVLFTLLLISGCLNRQETITVDEKGNTTISVEIEGAISDENPVYALPISSEWTVVKHKIDTTDEGKIKLELESNLVVPYSTKFPQNFSNEPYVESPVYLQFPSEVKKWREGKRTYYSFERVYRARKYFRYNYLFEEEFDKKIEEKILDKGIFGVTENERKQYLWQMSKAYNYLQIQIFEDLTGLLVKDGLINIAVKNAADSICASKLSQKITEENLLEILKKSEAEIQLEFTRFNEAIDKIFITTINSLTQNASVVLACEKQLDKLRLYNQITEDIDGHEFNIIVSLPGEIIVTNGLTDKEYPGHTSWTFKGTDLHDRDIPLYVLSVVER